MKPEDRSVERKKARRRREKRGRTTFLPLLPLENPFHSFAKICGFLRREKRKKRKKEKEKEKESGKILRWKVPAFPNRNKEMPLSSLFLLSHFSRLISYRLP